MKCTYNNQGIFTLIKIRKNPIKQGANNLYIEKAKSGLTVYTGTLKRWVG